MGSRNVSSLFRFLTISQSIEDWRFFQTSKLWCSKIGFFGSDKKKFSIFFSFPKLHLRRSKVGMTRIELVGRSNFLFNLRILPTKVKVIVSKSLFWSFYRWDEKMSILLPLFYLLSWKFWHLWSSLTKVLRSSKTIFLPSQDSYYAKWTWKKWLKCFLPRLNYIPNGFFWKTTIYFFKRFHCVSKSRAKQQNYRDFKKYETFWKIKT